jgi:hypothetical protein
MNAENQSKEEVTTYFSLLTQHVSLEIVENHEETLYSV